MQHQLMDLKRNINASRVCAEGCTICTSGDFSILLMNDGTYTIMRLSSGKPIASGLSKQDTEDLYMVCMSAKRWGNHHNVVK